MATQIEFKNVKKAFGDNVVLKDLNLEIQQGEFITLLGSSGCGKTTTLRILGGFESPDSGQVFFKGKDITKIPPHLRPVNTLFQQYSLFPHLSVFENVAFGMRIKKAKEEAIKAEVAHMLKLVNLADYGNRMPDSLSGGQKQRVAMARALVLNPEVFLLDEPLGALDLKLRQEMQLELKRIQKSTGITFVFVTHDQEEALTMSDRIVIMNQGEIQQIGTPVDIYNEPKNAYVADFVGESNILPGIMHKDFDVSFSGHRFECVDKGFAQDEAVDVVVRPEDVELVAPQDGMLKGEVLSSLFMGVHNEMRVKTPQETYLVHTTLQRQVGEIVGMVIVPDNIHIMKKEGRWSEKP